MYYAILAYHAEGVVESWGAEEDASLMTELLEVNARKSISGRPPASARPPGP